jgi:sulfite reductase (ferredoxin)
MTVNSPTGTDAPPGGSRLLGVYPQKQDGLFMQRIKIPGGRINRSQWRRAAQLAATYAGESPLHVTTRQDVEFHNVSGRHIAAVQQRLAEVGLSVFGAGGDSVRNVTVCGGCDVCDGGYDLLPLALMVGRHLEQEPIALTLPRKFKISFSGCPRACAKPWLNDLGFIAQPDGRFTVIGAGSLGPRPSLGILLYENMNAEDVLPVCLAAVEFFNRHGDRENRRRARLRHVREKMGDDAFKAELDHQFKLVAARQPWPRISPAPARRDVKQQCHLQLPNGNITASEALCLVDVSDAADAAIRIDSEHGVSLYGCEPVRLPDSLAAMTTAPVIVACPGCATCPRGLVDCRATADRIREKLSSRDSSHARICISGCSNNCAQSAAAQIGLVGMVRSVEGRPSPHYRLFTGGGNGANGRLADPSVILQADAVPAAIDTLLRQMHARRPT